MPQRLVVIGVVEPPPPFTPAIPKFGPGLRFALCDRLGQQLVEFHDRKNSEVVMNLNEQRTASVEVSIYDPKVPQIKALETYLKVWYGGSMVFVGPVLVPRFQYDTGRVTISAIDGVFRLQKAYILNQLAGTLNMENWISALIGDNTAHGNSAALGMVQGQLDTCPALTQTLEPGTQSWQGIKDITDIFGGPDFELAPRDATDGIHWVFNVRHPRLGSDKTNTVSFEYGTGQHNAIAFSHDPSGEKVVNWQTVIGEGDTPPAWTARHAGSRGLLGTYQEYEAYPAEELAIVQDRAHELVAAYKFPPDFFAIVPALEGLDEGYGIPPKVLEDYGMGDTVAVRAKKGDLNLDLRGRVVGIRLFEADDAGNVRTELTCLPEVDATGVTGS